MYVVSSNGQANFLEVPEMSLSRQRVPMTVFFLFAFGVPWGAMIIARIRHVALSEATLSFMIAAAFCSIGGLVATHVAAGRAGLKELGLRCVLYRVGVSWWLYALFLAPCVYAVATVIYGVARGKVGPVSPMELLRQWWLVFTFVFNLFQGPLAEELGWRGFLLPRLLDKCSPLKASVILGIVWAVWHMPAGMVTGGPYYFHTLAGTLLFTASTVALSILMTVLFLHTRGSVLLAIAMHWSVMPGKYIVSSLFPASQEPPDWLRAVVLITVAAVAVAVTDRKLSLGGNRSFSKSRRGNRTSQIDQKPVVR
jgi:membrane protease YdiL (CAAX protease family)